MSDAGFQTALGSNDNLQSITVPDAGGAIEWPGFAYYDGQKFWFGRTAEDAWFVHPRQVTHTFWTRLAHEPSPLGPSRKPAPFSELAFHFLREFTGRIATSSAKAEKFVLAVPGAYLKDPATEEEKIGLLLGMADELKVPLAGVVDMACAALCDPRGPGFNHLLPIVVVDLHLDGADLTLLTIDERLERKDYIHLPHFGYAQLLKHFTATMGNRFLRQTAFDILEDGRIEQTFFRQTKDFFLGEIPEHRFQINTAARTYEMLAKREQLVADAQQFVNGLVQALQTFLQDSPYGADSCTIALTDRSARLPGGESRLRAAGFNRIIRLPVGAAASGAARLGEKQLNLPGHLAEVPVESTVPAHFARKAAATTWEVRLQKPRVAGTRLTPTHAILEGIGHAIGTGGRFTIGAASVGANLTLPEAFNHQDDYAVPLAREGDRWWFIEDDAARHGSGGATGSARTLVEAGDRLTIRCGAVSAEILFANCAATNGARAHS